MKNNDPIKASLKLAFKKIDWDFVLDLYHKKNILWEFNGKIIDYRIPNKKELKEELENTIKYIIDNGINYIIFDVFVIIYDEGDTESPDNLIISLLYDTVSIFGVNNLNGNNEDVINKQNTKTNLSELKLKLEELVQKEFYEEAKKIKDIINELEKEL